MTATVGHPLMAHLTWRKDQTFYGQDVDPKPYRLRSLRFNKNPTIRTVELNIQRTILN
jgi:hypothetical protein